jgi:predicted ribosomally synthesized peptide with nif11-like leader
MSKEEIERFHQEVLGNQALQRRLKQATDDPSLVALTLEVGQEKGYKFTKPEAEEYIKQVSLTRARGQLSDAQLEAVAGGRAKPSNYLDNCNCE